MATTVTFGTSTERLCERQRFGLCRPLVKPDLVAALRWVMPASRDKVQPPDEKVAIAGQMIG